MSRLGSLLGGADFRIALKVASDLQMIGAQTSSRKSNQKRHPKGLKGAGRWTKNPLPPVIVPADDVQVVPVMGLPVMGLKDESTTHWVSVKKIDGLRGIVYGLVYEPNRLDSQGEFMTPENVEIMAHRFLQLNLSQSIDTKHDETPTLCYPVESFIARASDPDYPEGGWVVGIQVTPEIAIKYESGELNGFSFGALVSHTQVDIEYEIIRDMIGSTEPVMDHDHIYFVQLNEAGRVIKGATSVTDNHSHDVLRASVTEEANGHVHRFFM